MYTAIIYSSVQRSFSGKKYRYNLKQTVMALILVIVFKCA